MAPTTLHPAMEVHRESDCFAALHVACLGPGESVTLPDAPYVHFFLPREGNA